MADYDLSSPKARKDKKLAVRARFYTCHAGARRLGYIKRDGRDGTWLAVESVPRSKKEKTRVLGLADDYTRADGEFILTYAQALAKAASGEALGQAKRDGLTVFGAVDTYYDHLKVRKPNADEYRRWVKSKIPDELGSTKVAQLSTTQLRKWVDSLIASGDEETKRRSQSTANRVLSLLKAPLNFAFQDEKNGIGSDAAWRRVKPFNDVDGVRQDDLSPQQVDTLIACAATFDQALADMIEGTYLIGSRAPGELAKVLVRDFDPRNETLSIPKAKTRKRVVTLSDEAVAFFTRMAKSKLPNALLMPMADGSAWPRTGHFRDVKRAVRLAKLPESVTLYTLRHAYISRALEAGMNAKLVADNCGTSLRMIEKHYAKVLAGTRKDQLQRSAPRLRAV